MAAEFIAEEGPLRGLVLPLVDSEEWTIGRDPDLCNLITEDPRASRRHLVCRKKDEGYEIENLSETNPILVNDRPLSEPILLKDLDIIKIGSNQFRFYQFGKQEDFEQKVYSSAQEERPYETIYQEEELNQGSEVHFDISPSRYFIKVLTGPNAGGEFNLETERVYVIGTDPSSCDIVFYDLSISRQHAVLSIDANGTITIEDKDSRNGVIVDRERIEGKAIIEPNNIISLGTTSFLVIDREAPRQTIVAPLTSHEEQPEEEELKPKEEVLESEARAPIVTEKVTEAKKPVSMAGLLMTLIIGGLIVLLGIGMISLFKGGQEIIVPEQDYNQEIQNALKNYPEVRYSFNKNNGKLFLLGHVSSGIQKSELLYNLQGLNFIKGVDDNIVIDEYVWQEMNILLAKNPDWRGISMQSPKPGQFVLTGYLKTNKEAAQLSDYVNLNFNYLDRLQNHVIVEEQLVNEVTSRLLQKGFNGVTPAVSNGELTLTGYVSSTQYADYQHLVQGFGKINGVRSVRNYVVSLSPEQAVIDLTDRYNVTGYSTHGDVNINVVINGRILTRGDRLDGMTIVSIQPDTIFLEKDGLKYKIEYNK